MISGIVFIFIRKLHTPSEFWNLNPQPHPSPFTRFYDRETAIWAHCPNDNMDLQGRTWYIAQMGCSSPRYEIHYGIEWGI